MNSNNKVTCPNCKNSFSIETALTADLEKSIQEKLKKEFNEKWLDEKRKAEAELQARKEQLNQDRKKLIEEQNKELEERKKEIETTLKQKLQLENEQKINSLQKQIEEDNERLKELRNLQLEKQEMQLKMTRMAEENEFQTKKMMLEMEKELKEKIKLEAEQNNELKLKEYQKRIDDQLVLIEDMKRKVEQGSMQLQGEVQELALENLLRQSFPFDNLQEVAKGARGADIIQIVTNTSGEACGKIVWESKRTKEFQPAWIDKFKADFRQCGGDIGVIVTQALPKEMKSFGMHEGIYICQYHEAKGLAMLLRQTLIGIHEASEAQVNRGEKMNMLYQFLTSNEFKHYIEAINEGFKSMNASIQSERNAMEKIWKEREKQIAKVLLNTAGLYGSIKGIAGSAVADIKGLELGE